MSVRVLVIEPAGNKWGSERALLDLLDYLDQVELAVCLPPKRPLQGELERRGIRTFQSYIYGLHEKTRLHRILAAIGVLTTCLRYRPNVIYLNQSGAYKVAWVAAVLLRIPIIAHIRIFEDVAYIAKQRPNPRLLRGIIAISQSIADEMEAFHVLDAIPRHTILDSFAVKGDLPPPAGEARVEGRFACVGRIAHIKGQDILIAALPTVKADPLRVQCVIAGNDDGEFARRLKEIAARGTGEVDLRWLGIIDDSVGLLKSCVAMVVPSHREALGRVLFEAWQAGAVPIVYAGSGGAAEIVAASGGGGVLYGKQNGAELAAAINGVLSLKPRERAQIVNRGRAWMAETCDPATYAERIAGIFAAAAGRAAA